MLTYKLANSIVDQTMLRLHHNINVMNVDGVILASGDKERIETIHEGAKEVVALKKPIIITNNNLADYPQTKPGINLPIFFQDEVVCVIGITGDAKELNQISSLVQLTAEVIVHQALIESQSEWQRKMSVHVFEELVHGSPIKGLLKERMIKLNIPFQAPFCIILLKGQQKSSSYRTLIQYLEDFFYKQPVLFGHYQLDEYYILTTEMNNDAISKMVSTLEKFIVKKFDLNIGVGKLVQEIKELPESYRTAQLAIQFKKKQTKTTFYHDIEIFTLFHSEISREYSVQLLSSLDAKLIETLQVFFDNNQMLLNTANSLHIHRHTLTYRLTQIKEKTSLDPLQFQDAIKLQIALWHLCSNV